MLRCRCRGRDCFVDNGSHRFRLQKVGYMHWSLRRSTFTMVAMPTREFVSDSRGGRIVLTFRGLRVSG